MKKSLSVMLLALPLFGLSQTNTFPTTGFAGIGTTTPQFRFHIIGNHNDTNLGLEFPNFDPTKQANLTLWASEPGLTFNGTGIGNNVYVSPSGGITRMITVKGGSYMRLLDQELRLNIVKSDGNDFTALHVNSEGNIGLGTLYPNRRLAVTHTTGYGQVARFSSKLEDEEVGIGTESNGFSWVGTTSNHNFQIYANNSPKVTVMASGYVGIGVTAPQEKLSVNGKILAHAIRVETTNWPDFVLEDNYVLPTLESIGKYIKEKGHLPDIPSAADVKANGVDLGEMNKKLLQKIEELTLHLINLKKEVEQLKAKGN